MKKLILLSGGLDSATCLAKSVTDEGADNTFALNMYYGQRQEKEIECARKLAEYYKVRWYRELQMDSIMQFSNSSLLKHSDLPVAHASYAKQKEEGGVDTYVPFRNGLFLSAATAVALSLGCGVVVYGAHKDDVADDAYPDCSESFAEAMKTAIEEGTGGYVTMEAPFIHYTKADIVAFGTRMKVPYKLTWSCYEGGDRPCGKCATCIDRAEAFKKNGLCDPALEE